MAVITYKYNIASKIGLKNNYGRLHFPIGTLQADVTATGVALDAILAPGIKQQLSLSAKDFDMRSLPATLNDFHNARIIFSSQNNKKTMTMWVPGVKSGNSEFIASQRAALEAYGISLVNLGLVMKELDGTETTMTKVKDVVMGNPVDCSQADTTNTNQTPS